MKRFIRAIMDFSEEEELVGFLVFAAIIFGTSLAIVFGALALFGK